ncbi:MAG TPA: hypothetical protein VMV94_10445 [Phycisphaerae bacterium]|nr:hypothetical protein [Phycisphaerae bacterium]
MTRATNLNAQASQSVLQWAAERQLLLAVSLCSDGRWHNMRSQLFRFDPSQGLLQITFPLISDTDAPPEISPGDKLGISFRRGHKKCILLGQVVLRRSETGADGGLIDTLLVRTSDGLRELQRRVYRRIAVSRDRFIAVKLWEGGVPSPGQPSWPLCAGRLANLSVGGILVEIRADQNPRLGVGDPVGTEIIVAHDREPLIVEAQYRHCCLESDGRLGLGLQFIGLEHNLPGRASITQIADLVKSLQHEAAAVDDAEES